jgi:hypothetical protein
VAVDQDGSLLVAGTSVFYVPAQDPSRAAVSVDDPPVAARRTRLRWRATTDGTARIDVFRGQERVASYRTASRAGTNAYRMAAGLPSGAVLRVDLTVKGAAGVAFDRTAVLGPGPLPAAIALAVAARHEDHSADQEEEAGGCRRMSARRVDCRVTTTNGSCGTIVAVFVRPRGAYLTEQLYSCPMRRRIPGDAQRPRRVRLVDVVRSDLGIR